MLVGCSAAWPLSRSLCGFQSRRRSRTVGAFGIATPSREFGQLLRSGLAILAGPIVVPGNEEVTEFLLSPPTDLIYSQFPPTGPEPRRASSRTVLGQGTLCST